MRHAAFLLALACGLCFTMPAVAQRTTSVAQHHAQLRKQKQQAQRRTVYLNGSKTPRYYYRTANPGNPARPRVLTQPRRVHKPQQIRPRYYEHGATAGVHRPTQQQRRHQARLEHGRPIRLRTIRPQNY